MLSKFTKSALVVSLFIILNISTSLGQATFTGASIDGSFHDPDNWTWEDGSIGIPDATTDIILVDFGFVVFPDSTATVRSITLTSDFGADIFLGENSVIEIYGDIVAPENSGIYITGMNFESEDFEENCKVRFLGDEDQLIENVFIYTGMNEVNKTNGNVTLSDYTIIFSKLKFQLLSNPVSISEPSIGNIILDNGSIMLENDCEVELPTFSSTQIPPHVIATKIPDIEEGENLFIYMTNNPLVGIPSGIQGTVFFPIGYDAYSYNPISVDQSGSNTNMWCVYIDTELSSFMCPVTTEGSFEEMSTVKYRWTVMPLELDFEVEEAPWQVSVVSNPATVSFSFNKANIGHEVEDGFWIKNLEHLYLANEEIDCDQYPITSLLSDTSSNFITVTKESQVDFPHFAIGGIEGSSSIENNKILYGVDIFPNPADDYLNIRFANQNPELKIMITDVLGRNIYQEQIKANQLNQLHQIDLSNYSSGSYLIQFNGDGLSFAEKFVKN